MQRLIKPEDIPPSLWSPEGGVVHLAPSLVNTWRALLAHANIYDKALLQTPDNIIGGMTKEATDEHLAWRFSGSSARVQLGVLDPRGKLSAVSDAFARVFSGGVVLIADLPCGSGAALLTILSTIAELRRESRLPRQPLTVKIVGGEISESAREYAQIGIEHIKDSLAEQAIWVSAEFVHWNVLDKLSTGDLNRTLTIAGIGCTARILVLANFSGFLESDSNWNKAKLQLENIFINCRDNESYAIWIEPQTNKVVRSGGLFAKLTRFINELLKFKSEDSDQDPIPVIELEGGKAEVQHPLRADHKFNVALAIRRFTLPRTKVTE